MQKSVEAVREEEVKLRGVGFVKEVGFKPGVKERWSYRCTKWWIRRGRIDGWRNRWACISVRLRKLDTQKEWRSTSWCRWEERAEKDFAGFMDNKENKEWVLNKAEVKRELLDTVKARKLAQSGHTVRKLHFESKKTIRMTFDYNFGKCRPIYKILSLSDSWEILYIHTHHKYFPSYLIYAFTLPCDTWKLQLLPIF